MTAAQAHELAWTVGGSIAGLLGLVVVILVGLAVVGEIRR